MSDDAQWLGEVGTNIPALRERGWSDDRIAEWLNQVGMPPPGGVWTADEIHKHLRETDGGRGVPEEIVHAIRQARESGWSDDLIASRLNRFPCAQVGGVPWTAYLIRSRLGDPPGLA